MYFFPRQYTQQENGKKKQERKSKKEKEEPSTYKTDTSKTPYQIDLTEKQPDGTDIKIYGIYKIEGDKLIICMSMSEKVADRPKEFKTAVGAQAMRAPTQAARTSPA